ncbi:MarR family transcriptional regulator [Staphylococcus debuckii]|uniref:MarR family transcriptional regulator n=1 Tax=Staphylococcus debuckii TaxID=2044912 RepID=UPI000F437074|nr:MarR family transcriptional regulator [Staphylococcus debuckii]AYU55817.1 MarR family transcriptional regulator [Staphylococcus debuckii]
MNKEEELMYNFRDLFNKISYLNKFEMEEALKGLTSTEVHCIEAIEENTNPNVRRLAETLYMTRGAISKLTRRLIKKELIESYQKEDNKKEIYFKLTDSGKAIYDTHEQLHAKFQKRDEKVFEEMDEAQYQAMMNFINQYRNHLDQEINKQNRAIN